MMRLLRAALLLVTAASPGWGASIGLFSDPGCADCNLTVPPGGTATFYIRALTEDIEPPGLLMQGAMFRITGLPSGWSAAVSPAPEPHLWIGEPFGTGAAVAYPFPRPDTCVGMLVVALTAPPGPVQEFVLQVAAAVPPFGWKDCPGFSVWCGDPCDYWDLLCTGGGALFVNSPRHCTVGVEPGTWSGVKQLFD